MNFIKNIYNYIKNNPYKNYFKIIVSLTILSLIFIRIGKNSLLENAIIPLINNITIKALVILILISIIKFFSQAINWYYVLKINQNYHCKLSDVLKTHLIGLALRFFMPGGHATFGKVFYINPDRKKETFFSIIAEKFFQTWIIIFFASWAALFFFDRYYLLLSVIALVISFLPFLITKVFNKYLSYNLKINYFNTLPKILTSQLIFILMTFIQYYVLITQTASIRFFDIVISVSLILLANIIPVTFSGLGLRETASALILPKYGISVELAISASLIIFFLNSVIPAIPGAFLINTKNRK